MGFSHDQGLNQTKKEKKSEKYLLLFKYFLFHFHFKHTILPFGNFICLSFKLTNISEIYFVL